MAPALERRNRFEGQVQQIGWSLYRYAWNSDAFMKRAATSGRWGFVPDLTHVLARSGYLPPQLLQDPLGRPLSVEELARTEKGFSADALTRDITRLLPGTGR